MSENHSHSNSRTPASFGKFFAISAALNSGIVILEVGYGLYAGSTALIADALHNATDVIGLLLAWAAFVLAQRIPSLTYTYGLRSGTVLASVLNGMLLMGATGAIVWEAIRRFSEPIKVGSGTVMMVAAIAIVINGFSAWLLSRGNENDINVRGAFLHLAADAGVSVGVVISGYLILKTGALWLDPVTSLVIACFILWSTWGLMKEAIKLALQAVPSSIDIGKVKKYLEDVPYVEKVHDLHVWPISTTDTALTAHLVVRSGFDSSILTNVAEDLEHNFRIEHPTIQLEMPDGNPCKLAPDVVV